MTFDRFAPVTLELRSPLSGRVRTMTATPAIPREIKQARRDMTLRNIPAVCAALRDTVRDLLKDIRESREKREKLKDSTWSADTRAAFNEGAGLQVFPA